MLGCACCGCLVLIRFKGIIPLVLAEDLRALERRRKDSQESGVSLLGPKAASVSSFDTRTTLVNDELSRMVPPEVGKSVREMKEELPNCEEANLLTGRKEAAIIQTLPRRSSEASDHRSMEGNLMLTPDQSDEVANSDMRSLESFDDLGFYDEKRFEVTGDNYFSENDVFLSEYSRGETDVDLASGTDHADLQGETDSASLVDLEPLTDDQMTASQLRERYAAQSELMMGAAGVSPCPSASASASGAPASSVDGDLDASVTGSAFSVLQETMTSSLQLLSVPEPELSPHASPRRTADESGTWRQPGATTKSPAQPPEASGGWRGGLAMFKQSLAILKEDYDDEIAERMEKKRGGGLGSYRGL